MRLAYFSPFNPQKTGVSDYSEELLPFLSQHCEVDLVVNGYTLSNPEIRNRFRILTPREFTSNSGRYDMAVYQLANNLEQHGYMIPCMQLCPGIAVLHDYYLHFLMLGLTLKEGDMPSLQRILRGKYGSSAPLLAHRILLGMFDPYQVSTTLPLVTMNRAVIVHNSFGKSLASEDAGDRPIRVIPMGIPIRPVLDATELKLRHGFRRDDFVLASVSTLSHTKRIPAILRAVGKLRQQYPHVRLLIMGGGKLGDGTRQLIQSLDLAGMVRQTGWLPSDSYWAHLNLADAVIDVRYPSGAETSASLLRAMSAGKPLIVSAQGSFLEIDPDCCQKISVGEAEESQLCAAVARLVEDPTLRARMGEASRRRAESEHRLDTAAESYVKFICEVLDTPWEGPDGDWFDARPGRAARTAYASIYKASRVVALLRNYGLRDTLHRIRAERHTPSAVTEAVTRGGA